MSVQSRHFYHITTLLIALLVVAGACRRDDPDYIAKRDREKILEYLEEHALDYQELDDGVFVVIEREGIGGFPSETSTVKLHYTGYLLNGTVFDSGQDASLYLPNTVQGFSIGVRAFQRDGKGKILIPSALGYGSFARGNIPRNSVLIFDVEIIDFS